MNLTKGKITKLLNKKDQTRKKRRRKSRKSRKRSLKRKHGPDLANKTLKNLIGGQEPVIAQEELDVARQEPVIAQEELDVARQEPVIAQEELDVARQEQVDQVVAQEELEQSANITSHIINVPEPIDLKPNTRESELRRLEQEWLDS
jgi:hypothetical protein